MNTGEVAAAQNQPEPFRSRTVGGQQYRDWLKSVDEFGTFVVPDAPIYAYRGDAAVLREDLSHIASAYDISYTAGDIAQMASLRSFAAIATFFSSHRARAKSLHGALLFFRRAIAHAHAYITGTRGYVYTRVCDRLLAKRKYVQDIEHAYVKEPGTPFAWHVIVGRTVYAIEFTRAVAEDPVMWYESITADPSNPVSRLWTPREAAPSVLDIAPQLIHADSFRGKSPEELDEEAVRATDDAGVMFLLNHFMRIMDPPPGANAREKEKYINDGRHLLLMIAWCIQNMRRSTQIIYVFTPVQQCGKTTIFSLLLSFLGIHSVIMMSVDVLKAGYLACLRGVLFMFLDEGGAAFEPAVYNTLKMLSGSDDILTHDKNEKPIKSKSGINPVALANDMMNELPYGDNRVCAKKPTGALRGNTEYFNRLHELLLTDAPRLAFLVLSRMSMEQIEHGHPTNFDPQVPSVRGAEIRKIMTDPLRCRVYKKLGALLPSLGTSYVPVTRVVAEVRRLAEREGCMSPDITTTQIITDLLNCAILKYHPAESFVSLLRRDAPDDAFAPLAPNNGVEVFLRKMVCIAVGEHENGMPVSEVARIIADNKREAGQPHSAADVDNFLAALACDGEIRMHTSPPYVSTCLRTRASAQYPELAIDGARKRTREN